ESLPESLSERLEDNVLAVISRVSLTLLTPLSLDETLGRVLECVFEVIPADRGYVMLFEAPEEDANGAPELVCKAMRTRTQASMNDSADVEITRTISDQVLKQGTS